MAHDVPDPGVQHLVLARVLPSPGQGGFSYWVSGTRRYGPLQLFYVVFDGAAQAVELDPESFSPQEIAFLKNNVSIVLADVRR